MALFSIEHINIVGLSAVVPSTIETNVDLNYLSDQEKKNLITTTGIENRRIADTKTTAADLCIRAAQRLLNEINWTPGEIDILVFVTQTPDYPIPGSSMFIQDTLGLGNHCLAIDINQGCAGYVYGLSVITSMMSAGKLKKGLLLVGDTITKTIKKNDRSLVPIFSDAGSCTAIEYNASAPPIFFNLQTDGSGYDKIIVKGKGGRNYDDEAWLQMNGQDIFNFGLKEVAANINQLLSEYKLNAKEIDYFVMHQANLLLNETIRKKVGIDLDKTLYSLKEYGNTSCASIPVSIAANADTMNNNIHGKVLLSGFGVGLSWGAAVIDCRNIKCLPVHEYQ